MSRKNTTVLLFLLLILAGVSFFLLKPRSREGYLFIEIWFTSHGEVLEGEPRSLMVDFPTYTFSKDEGVLYGLLNFEVNSSLLLVVGVGESLSGDAGGGVTSSLEGIYSLPREVLPGIVIVRMLDDGRVYLSVNGTEFVLVPGQSWEKKREYTMDWEGGRIRISETLTIRNHGHVKLESW